MAKKSSRVLVGLVSTETESQDYVTQHNTLTKTVERIRKYDPKARRHVEYKVKKKLK